MSLSHVGSVQLWTPSSTIVRIPTSLFSFARVSDPHSRWTILHPAPLSPTRWWTPGSVSFSLSCVDREDEGERSDTRPEDVRRTDPRSTPPRTLHVGRPQSGVVLVPSPLYHTIRFSGHWSDSYLLVCREFVSQDSIRRSEVGPVFVVRGGLDHGQGPS